MNVICSHCNKRISVRADGRVRRHKSPFGNTCPGSEIFLEHIDDSGCTGTTSDGTELVIIKQETPVTSTLAIAEGTGVEHRAVLQLVKNFRKDLEKFGQVAFEMRSGEIREQGGTGRPTRIALLNERQATLLMTYMRNNETIRGFKMRLVDAFFKMAEAQKKNVKTPTNLAEALRLAADQEEERMRLAAVVEAKDFFPLITARE